MSSAESDGNRQPGLIALCVLMLILAVVSVALRCWSIWGSPNHRFGYDDAFAILTLVRAVPYRGFPPLGAEGWMVTLCFIALHYCRISTYILLDLSGIGSSFSHITRQQSTRGPKDYLRRRLLIRCMHYPAQTISALLLPSSAETGSHLGPPYALGCRRALRLLAGRGLVGDHLPVYTH